MASAEYYRQYRLKRKEELNRQARERRRIHRAPRDRTKESAQRASRAVVLPDIPAAHTGHELFDRAWKLVPQRDGLTTLCDPKYDDLRSVAVLAMLEGEDPEEAINLYRAKEVAWKYHTTELPEWS